jgi:hypothetical protein
MYINEEALWQLKNISLQIFMDTHIFCILEYKNVHMWRYVMVMKTDLETFMDLHVFSTPEYKTKY